MQSRLAEPMSRKQIRDIALSVRKLIGFEDQLFFPVVEFVELILPQLDPAYEFIVETEATMGNCHGLTYPDKNTIIIRDDVYLRAIDGNGRDRLTIAHELFHLLKHNNSNVSLARLGQGVTIATYCDPEWQADAFGGELLIPKHLITNMSIDQIASECQVSVSAAKLQKKCS